MNRETTNRIRFVLEDVLPPFMRDSAMFRGMASLAWGRHIGRLAAFRERAPFLTAEEYETLYREHPRVHEGTDNSEACIRRIIDDTVGETVCDVGCGTGVLLERILWAAREERQFIECDTYLGPDRRFKNEGPPIGVEGRRRDDLKGELGGPSGTNLSQDQINDMMKPSKVKL